MLEITDKLLAKLQSLPFLEGYFYGIFFLNQYPEEDILRYGCVYARMANNQLILVVEEMPELPDLSGYRSQQIGDTKVYLGYFPKYSFLRSTLGETNKTPAELTASFILDSKLITVLPISINLEPISAAEKVLSLKWGTHQYEISQEVKNLKYLPQSGGDWEFVTAFKWLTEISEDESNTHRISHIQGNYRKENNFINIELRFGCAQCSSLEGLRPAGLVNEEKITLDGLEIHKGELNGSTYFYCLNEEHRYIVISHDNQKSSPEDKAVMLSLLKEAIGNLKKYFS